MYTFALDYIFKTIYFLYIGVVQNQSNAFFTIILLISNVKLLSVKQVTYNIRMTYSAKNCSISNKTINLLFRNFRKFTT